jgi:hypothetical protein
MLDKAKKRARAGGPFRRRAYRPLARTPRYRRRVSTTALSRPFARTRIVLALALSCLAAAGADAATVSLRPDGDVVVLEGRIDLGDFDKLNRLATTATPTVLYLASPGGNLAEAMRIGLLVRSRGWETRSAEPASVPAEMRIAAARAMGVRDPVRNDVCASACFFVFASGIYRDGHALGIHMPYIAPAELQKMTTDEAERKTGDVKTLVAAFLRRMSVPLKYFDAMLDVPYDRMRWLSDEEIAGDLHGFAADVREWATTQCPGEAVDSAACRDKVMLGVRLRAMQERAGR